MYRKARMGHDGYDQTVTIQCLSIPILGNAENYSRQNILFVNAEISISVVVLRLQYGAKCIPLSGLKRYLAPG
jgi:hypothetical protein